jgi:hypothetical protein
MMWKSERRSVPEAPFIFDGGKPNSVLQISSERRSFISSGFLQTPGRQQSAVIDRRYRAPCCDDTRR